MMTPAAAIIFVNDIEHMLEQGATIKIKPAKGVAMEHTVSARVVQRSYPDNNSRADKNAAGMHSSVNLEQAAAGAWFALMVEMSDEGMEVKI